MSVVNRVGYEQVLAALGICVSARIPVLIWGNPGEGKTSAVESARDAGWLVETLIVSHYEPSDFVGLPVITAEGGVRLAPPEWATRLTEHEGPAIAFFDEFSTASPALQAAVLRPLTHYEIGSLQLPRSVSFVAAANPADVAAAGWELAPPTASRFVHLDWALPLDVYAECMVTGRWPTMRVHDEPVGLADAVRAQRVLISGFLRARTTQLSAIPRQHQDRGRAFPTPRTWDYAARLAGFAESVGAGDAVRQLLIAGCVGGLAAHEFTTWVTHQDLPDPEKLLADPSFDFTGMRGDRVYVTLQGVLGAVATDSTAERWSAAVDLCARAAEQVSIDVAVPAIQALVRPTLRPDGVNVPASIKVFASTLALAGLLPQ